MLAKPREVRQARTFHYRRGNVVSSRFCKVFVTTAKAMRCSFAQLDEFMRSEVANDVGTAFDSSDLCGSAAS